MGLLPPATALGSARECGSPALCFFWDSLVVLTIILILGFLTSKLEKLICFRGMLASSSLLCSSFPSRSLSFLLNRHHSITHPSHSPSLLFSVQQEFPRLFLPACSSLPGSGASPPAKGTEPGSGQRSDSRESSRAPSTTPKVRVGVWVWRGCHPSLLLQGDSSSPSCTFISCGKREEDSQVSISAVKITPLGWLQKECAGKEWSTQAEEPVSPTKGGRFSAQKYGLTPCSPS